MKKIFILLFALILVVSACGSKPAAQGEKLSGSIADLLAKNKSLKCEVIAKDGADIISGTTYMSGGKARSDYQNKMNNETVNGHMIMDGTWVYTWMDQYPDQAIKMKVDTMQSDALKNGQAADQAQNSGINNYENSMDYNCTTWTPNSASFAVPGDVNFIDYSKMLESLQGLTNPTGGIPSGNSEMCGACASITDATGKAACLKQLGCK